VHPALPVLAALTLGAWWLTRRRLGVALLVVGLAGTALVWPALEQPDGILSPAASLARFPPWQGVADPAAGNPVLRDVAHQIQPWLLHLRRELRQGRLPFWNPHQLSGAPFWSNGQSAPLFPLHLAFAALPLTVGFVLLPWLRLVLGGVGTYCLARRLGLAEQPAALAAVVFPLSGMLVSFLLFPMGSALALVPWVLWAVEGIARGTAGWGPLALLAGAQLLAGHPETSIHTALLCVVYRLVRGGARGSWRRLAAGWAAAAGLAAVQLAPLAVTVLESAKWLAHDPGGGVPLALLLVQPLRLLLPQLYGHPAEGTWWGPFNYSATAVYVGAVALLLASAAWPRVRSDHRWRAIGAMLAVSFVVAYHLPPSQALLGSVPVLGHVAHHRLIFGIELALALLAAAGAQAWLGGRRRELAWGAGGTAVILALTWTLFLPAWREQGQLSTQAGWSLWWLTVAAVLLGIAGRARLRLAALPVLVGVAAAELLVAHGAINPALPLQKLYPVTGAAAFLQGAAGRVAGTRGALHPNAAMVYGLYDVRGDDPLKLVRYEQAYATFAPSDPVYFQPIEDWEAPWLDRLGVRWVVSGPAEEAPRPEWPLAYQGGDARVWERPGALPLVRWAGGDGDGVEIARRRPGEWWLRWRSEVPRRLVVAETWAPGWSARCSGAPCPLLAQDGLLLAVDLKAGEGTVRLRYIPRGVIPGALSSLVSLVAVALASVRRPRGPL
jgi:hypothetical protein